MMQKSYNLSIKPIKKLASDLFPTDKSCHQIRTYKNLVLQITFPTPPPPMSRPNMVADRDG